MIDVLAPLGMALLIALIGYAMIHTGRAQRAAKAKLFEGFADQSGFRYEQEDDGRAQEFADGFDGVGRFRSSSLGEIVPKHVVSGTMRGSVLRETIAQVHDVSRGSDRNPGAGKPCHRVPC